MSIHIYTIEECKKLIEELGIISCTEKRINVCKKKIPIKLLESILFYTEKCRDNLSERIYWILNNIKDYPICKQCGKQFQPRFYGIRGNYNGSSFCSSKCSVNNIEIIEKTKQTNLRNCGYENPSQSPKIKQKKEETCIKNHGVKNPWKIKEIREKAEQTCVEKYDAKYPLQSKIIQTKIENICLENWNVKHPLQSKEIQEKRKQTCLENHNVEYPLQSPIIKENSKQTSLKNWNAKHPMQNKEFFIRNIKNAYKQKLLILPSGKEITYQGYENIVILKLLEIGYKEEQIITDTNLIPSFKYTFENKDKIYYPDIYIPHENKIIEVKSTFTYSYGLEMNLAKRQTCLDQGYQFEFWICSDKKVLEII